MKRQPGRTGQGAGVGACQTTLGELVCDVASSRPGGFARVKVSRRERGQADRAVWAEVGSAPTSRDRHDSSPAPGGSSHTTVRKPTCLGGGGPLPGRIARLVKGVCVHYPGRSVEATGSNNCRCAGPVVSMLVARR